MHPTVTTETTPKETFSGFRENRGSAAPADVTVEVTNPVDTGDQPPAGENNGNQPAAPAKTAEPSDGSTPQDKVEKRKSQIQREIDELVAKREALKREVAQPTDTKTAAPSTPAPAAAAYDGVDANDPKPKVPSQNDPKYTGPNAYEQYEEDRLRYAIDTAKWETRRDNRLDAQKAAVSKQQEAHKEALDAFESRGSDFAAEHEDYTDLVDKFKTRNISNETAAVIVNAENGPAILYELMTNPDELKRIESLPTVIGRLDAMYELKYKLKYAGKLIDDSNPNPANTRPKSAAPAVGTRTNGTGGGGSKEPATFAGFRKAKFG